MQLKIKQTLLLLLVFLSSPLWATSPEINVIEKQLLQTKNQERLPLLAKLTEYYFDEAPAKAKEYGEEALLLLEDFPDIKLQLSIGHYLFDAYRNLSELEKAETLAYKNHKIAEKQGDLHEKAEANVDLSSILSNKNSDYKGAIKYLNTACSQLGQLKDMISLGSCYNNTGLAYYYDTNYEEALRFYLKALEIENYRTQIEATHTLGNIALINMQYRRWQEALTYYQQALEHATPFNKNAMISEQLINIGVAYLFNDELDKSIEYLNKANQLEKEIGNVNSLFRIAKRLGEVYVEKKQFNTAIEYYQRASILSTEMSSDHTYIEITMAIGVLNAKLENFTDALVYFHEALIRAEKIQRKPFIYEAHENLYITNKDLGNFETALYHYETHIKLKNEKTESERLNKISELEVQYNAEQREAQILLLTKDKQLESLKAEQQQYYVMVSFAFLMIVAGFFFYRQKQKAIISSERADLIAELIEKKNQLLADVSHELGTPLTVLKLQVESLKDNLEDDVQATYNSLDNKLNDIEHLIDDIHQLAQSDIGALQMNIEQFQFNDTLAFWEQELTQFVNKNKLTFNIVNDIPDNLMVNFDRDRIKQIFINLLNNSIKYTKKPGNVKLSASVNNNMLNLFIEDSAPGVPDKELTKIFERLYRVENSRSRETGGSGLGLAICKSLIVEHKGNIYAEHSSLGGLKVVIELPLPLQK